MKKLIFLITTFMLNMGSLSALREPGDISLLLYRGKFSNTGMLSIMFEQSTDYLESYISVGGLNYQLKPRLRSLRFETEGQLGVHSGIMKHIEFNGALLARLPISNSPFSIAFGEGLSLATRNPDLEREPFFFLTHKIKERQKSNRLLNFLLVELEMALPVKDMDPHIFMRIHHRSGVYSTYCPPTCGSNFIAYGIKFNYDTLTPVGAGVF